MNFGIVDWTVLIVFMLGTTFIGHKLRGKSNGLDDFFLGGRGLPWWAVSCSIIASQISAVTIIALPGAVFRDGGNLLFLQGTLIGFIVAKFLMALLFIKPFYEKKIYSPYDFIEDRLGAKASSLARGLFVISAIIGHGIRLLTVALVLSVVVDIPIGQSVLIIGVFAVGWTLMGGVATVIWTDFVLFIIISGGALISTAYLFSSLDMSLMEAVRDLDAAAKLKLIDISLDPVKTWTIWTSLICFTIFELAQNSVDQVITQRMMCCRTYQEARKAVLGSIGGGIIGLLMVAVSLGIWLFYQDNPLSVQDAAFVSEQPSRIYPFFIVNELPTGLSGLMIAAIFAAGISTLDSALAALSETTVNGFYRKWVNPDAGDKECLRASRYSVVAWGVLLSVLAYVAGKVVQNEGLLNLAYKAPILTYGPMLMIALFALARFGSYVGMLGGVLVSVVVAVLLLLGSSTGLILMDQFWIYPITCVVFLVTAYSVTKLKAA